MVFALFVFFNSRTCTNFTLWMANVCVFSLEPFSQNTLCQPQSAYLHAVGSLILWRHSPWILVNCALRRLARLPKVCFFFFLFFFFVFLFFFFLVRCRYFCLVNNVQKDHHAKGIHTTSEFMLSFVCLKLKEKITAFTKTEK